MARKARFHRSGGFFHVMLRGNDGQHIFFSDTDRYKMCFLMQEGVERYGHKIHAFCFMSNHIHLLVQVNDISLSKIIHNLAFRYTRYVNKSYQKIGHLFQGRFRSILLDEEGYFTKLLRYIHLNPVKARLVSDPCDYEWSSHRSFLGLHDITWLTTDYGLFKFSDNLQDARNRYIKMMLSMQESENDDFDKGNLEAQILGRPFFLEQLSESYQLIPKLELNLEGLAINVCKVFDIDPGDLIAESQKRTASLARGLLGYIVKSRGEVTMCNLAKYLRRDLSTISSLVSRFELRLQKDAELQSKISEFLSTSCNLQA